MKRSKKASVNHFCRICQRHVNALYFDLHQDKCRHNQEALIIKPPYPHADICDYCDKQIPQEEEETHPEECFVKRKRCKRCLEWVPVGADHDDCQQHDSEEDKRRNKGKGEENDKEIQAEQNSVSVILQEEKKEEKALEHPNKDTQDYKKQEEKVQSSEQQSERPSVPEELRINLTVATDLSEVQSSSLDSRIIINPDSNHILLSQESQYSSLNSPSASSSQSDSLSPSSPLNNQLMVDVLIPIHLLHYGSNTEDTTQIVRLPWQLPQELSHFMVLRRNQQRLERMVHRILDIMHIFNEQEQESPPTGLTEEEMDFLLTKREGKRGQNGLCPICHCDLNEGDSLTKLPCHHEYHTDCVRQWMGINPKCPVCKGNVWDTIETMKEPHNQQREEGPSEGRTSAT